VTSADSLGQRSALKLQRVAVLTHPRRHQEALDRHAAVRFELRQSVRSGTDCLAVSTLFADGAKT